MCQILSEQSVFTVSVLDEGKLSFRKGQVVPHGQGFGEIGEKELPFNIRTSGITTCRALWWDEEQTMLCYAYVGTIITSN